MADGSILVVLPTLGDRLGTLAETLDSVEQQRGDVSLRLVVVLPTRATEARALCRARGALVVDDPATGISEAINAGLAAAQDETFYAWIGDDDLFRPHGLRTLRDLMADDAGIVVAYGGCDYIDDAGTVLFTSRAGRLARWLLAWGPDLVPHPGSLIRLDAMRRVGLFDPSLRYVMDLDMFLRLRGQGRFVSTRRSVSAFRWHADSLTVANRAGSSAEADLVKRRHLPAPLRPLAPLWHAPVRWASARAAAAANARARAARA